MARVQVIPAGTGFLASVHPRTRSEASAAARIHVPMRVFILETPPGEIARRSVMFPRRPRQVKGPFRNSWPRAGPAPYHRYATRTEVGHERLLFLRDRARRHDAHRQGYGVSLLPQGPPRVRA